MNDWSLEIIKIVEQHNVLFAILVFVYSFFGRWKIIVGAAISTDSSLNFHQTLINDRSVLGEVDDKVQSIPNTNYEREKENVGEYG